MIDTVFSIKVRMSGLSINRYRPILGRLLDARPLPYRCISTPETDVYVWRYALLVVHTRIEEGYCCHRALQPVLNKFKILAKNAGIGTAKPSR